MLVILGVVAAERLIVVGLDTVVVALRALTGWVVAVRAAVADVAVLETDVMELRVVAVLDGVEITDELDVVEARGITVDVVRADTAWVLESVLFLAALSLTTTLFLVVTPDEVVLSRTVAEFVVDKFVEREMPEDVVACGSAEVSVC